MNELYYSIAMAPSSRTLEELRQNAEKLWALLLEEKDPKAKELVRKKYRNAFETYKKQSLIEEGLLQKQRFQSLNQKKIEPLPKPDIFTYLDFASYLNDLFRSLDLPTRLKIAKASKLPDAVFRSVLVGDAYLGQIGFQKILPLLPIMEEEVRFLTLLFETSEAETAEDRATALNKMRTFPEFAKHQPEGMESWTILEHWFYVVIREMSTLKGFQADAKWIRPQLGHDVSQNLIEKALEYLKAKGFITVSSDGRVHSHIKSVQARGGVYRVALANFHREMLAMASQAIAKVPSSQRFVLGRTIALTQKGYEEVMSVLNKSLRDIEKIDAAESAENPVYHIGFFAVPVTKPTN